MSLRSNTIMFHKTGMNETEHKRTVSEVPRHSWMKKMAIALGIILLASVSLNVVLWFETLEEVHTNISSVLANNTFLLLISLPQIIMVLLLI